MMAAGDMLVLDGDTEFANIFRKTNDEFEIENLNLALSFVTNWECAIDGGAHYGSWTRSMAKQFDTVYAFEPCEDIFECLVYNTQQYDNVVTEQKALGARHDIVKIGRTRGNSGTSNIIPKHDPRKPAFETSAVTIDSLQLDVGFIKLDIEGYEYFAIKGARKTISRCKPIIIFEDKGHGRLYRKRQGLVANLLEQLGAKELARAKNDYVYGWE